MHTIDDGLLSGHFVYLVLTHGWGLLKRGTTQYPGSWCLVIPFFYCPSCVCEFTTWYISGSRYDKG